MFDTGGALLSVGWHFPFSVQHLLVLWLQGLFCILKPPLTQQTIHHFLVKVSHFLSVSSALLNSFFRGLILLQAAEIIEVSFVGQVPTFETLPDLQLILLFMQPVCIFIILSPLTNNSAQRARIQLSYTPTIHRQKYLFTVIISMFNLPEREKYDHVHASKIILSK